MNNICKDCDIVSTFSDYQTVVKTEIEGIEKNLLYSIAILDLTDDFIEVDFAELPNFGRTARFPYEIINQQICFDINDDGTLIKQIKYDLDKDYFIFIREEKEIILKKYDIKLTEQEIPFDIITVEESLNKINEDCILIYSLSDCVYCKKVLSYFKENENEKIYYVNMNRLLREQHDIVYETAFEFYRIYLEGFNKIPAPFVVYCQNGTIQKTTIGDDEYI